MRKNQAVKRDVLPDPVYNSQLVTRAINKIMLDGKRGNAQTIFYEALKIVADKTKENPNVVFEQAIENVKPQVELKKRRIGGANYQVPIPVDESRQKALALRWLINYARLRNEKEMTIKLANEIIDAANRTGGAAKKCEETYKMAEANKAFAHYRW